MQSKNNPVWCSKFGTKGASRLRRQSWHSFSKYFCSFCLKVHQGRNWVGSTGVFWDADSAWRLSQKIDPEIKWRQIVIKFTALFTTALSHRLFYFELYFKVLAKSISGLTSISLMHRCTLKIHIFFTTKREWWYMAINSLTTFPTHFAYISIRS